MLNFENMSRPEMIAGHLSRAAPQSDPAPLPRRGKSKERRLEP